MKRFRMVVLLALAACSNLVPGTVMQMTGLSPLTADPADFAVRLDLPAGIGIQPRTARLRLTARQGAGGQTLAVDAALEQVAFAVPEFRIAPGDLAALRAAQARAAAWKAENAEGAGGSLSVDLQPCLVGTVPAPDATVDVSLRIAADGPFLPLVRRGPLSAVVGETELAQLPACDAGLP